MENKSILIIDDDQSILVSLEMLLQDCGYDTQTSSIYSDFVNATIEKQPPDLILLDILLSGYDGRVICKTLKSKEETKRIPVILMSAHPDAKAMSKQAGADGFLPKPFDIDLLLDEIERLTA